MKLFISRIALSAALILLTNYLSPTEQFNGVVIYSWTGEGSFIVHGLFELFFTIAPRIASSIYTDNFNVYNPVAFQTIAGIQSILLSYFLTKFGLQIYAHYNHPKA